MNKVVRHGSYLFANAAFVSVGNQFYFGRSEDGGLTWSPLQPDSLRILPTLEGNLFANSGGKIFKSDDEGLTWKFCLDYSYPSFLTYSDDMEGEGILFISGRALWRPRSVANAFAKSRPVDFSERLRYRLQSGVAKVNYGLEFGGFTRLGLFSTSGESISSIINGYRPKGSGEVSFPVANLKGLYWLVLEAGGQRSARPFFAN